MTAQNEDLSEDCVKISRPYLVSVSKKLAVKERYGQAGQLIVLNDSASPKMVTSIAHHVSNTRCELFEGDSLYNFSFSYIKLGFMDIQNKR